MIDYTLDQVREAVRATTKEIEGTSCGRCLVSVTARHFNPETIYASTTYVTNDGTGTCKLYRDEFSSAGSVTHELSPMLVQLAIAFDNRFAYKLVSVAEALAFIDEFEKEYAGE